MNKEFAWFLGMLVSDGSIVRPTNRGKGDEKRITFCIKNTDKPVLYKIKAILNTGANVREYPNYKSPQAQINIYDRKDIMNDYDDIKTVVPDIDGYERHFIRGICDGDGCLNYRVNRNSFRINFINEHYEIVKWISNTLSDNLLIEYKEPKFKECDNLYIIEWEGKIARLIAWYLYHGSIDNCCLDRKKDYYKKYVLDDNDVSGNDEIVKALNLDILNDTMCMNVNASKTLNWCHIVKNIINLNVTPVPQNKGKTKYYALHIKTSDC